MFCPHCGSQTPPGAVFCGYCGIALAGSAPDGSASSAQIIEQSSTALAPQPLAQRQRSAAAAASGKGANADPRKQQVRALRLQVKQLRLELRQVNMQLQQIRNQHGQGAPFVPWGIVNRVYREVENIQLSGPQQRKQQLQQEILTLEQQILALESQMGG